VYASLLERIWRPGYWNVLGKAGCGIALIRRKAWVRRSLSLPVGQRQLQIMTAPSQSAGNARSCGRGRPLARPRGRLTGIKYVVLVHIDPVWCAVPLVQTSLPSRCTGMRVISPPSPCPALFPFEKLGKGSTAGGFSLAPGK
jgi:hypothetical protein